MSISEYLKILHLPSDASLDDIKKAYRQFAKQYHPDINKKPNAHEKFIQISEAYEMLIKYKTKPSEIIDNETIVRQEYERARNAARQRAKQQARMRYQKFKDESEVFKESGWYDFLLLLKYIYRWFVIPFMIFVFILPIVSEDIGAHPSGYVFCWLFFGLLVLYVYNNRKNYFFPGKFFHSAQDVWKKIREYHKMPTGTSCYYCNGKLANARPYKLELFKTIKAQINFYGGVRGGSVGFKRRYKKLYIPRSKKAYIVHSTCSAIKFISIILSLAVLPAYVHSHWKIIIGIFIGFLLSSFVLIVTKTKSKVSHLYSPGIFIKFGLYILTVIITPSFAFLYLIFESFLEATFRYISNDKWYFPVIKQNSQLQILLEHHYQFYNEFPMWSVIYPFVKWII